MDNHEPWLFMLIGLPNSGKSTYRNSPGCPLNFLSSDNYIEQIARILGTTYSDIFSSLIKHSTKAVNRDLESYLSKDYSFVWDQTNLTFKSRFGRLSRIPFYYRRMAVFFDVPWDIIIERNEKRKIDGRNVPYDVLMKMRDEMEPPEFSEGFDAIQYIDEFGNEIKYQENLRDLSVISKINYYK